MNLSYFHTFHLPINFQDSILENYGGCEDLSFSFLYFFLEINQGGGYISYYRVLACISHLSHLGDVPLISEHLFWTDGVKVAPILSGKTDHQVPHLFHLSPIYRLLPSKLMACPCIFICPQCRTMTFYLHYKDNNVSPF